MALKQTNKIIIKGEDRTKSAFRGVKSSIKETGESAKALGLIIAGGAGVFAVAGKQAIDTADRIGKLSRQLGLSTELISEMRHATELTGSSFETLTTGMSKLQRNAVLAGEGLASQARAFERIGISVEAIQGLSPDDLFASVAEAISRVEDPTIKSASAMDLFGRAGRDLIPLFEGGAGSIEKMRMEARELGKSLSGEQTLAAENANDAITRLTAAFSGMTEQLAIQLAPTLEGVANFIGSILPIAVQASKIALASLQSIISGMISNLSGAVAAWFEFGAGIDLLPDKLQNFYGGVASGAREVQTITDNLAKEFAANVGDMTAELKSYAFQMGEAADVMELDLQPAQELFNRTITETGDTATKVSKEIKASMETAADSFIDGIMGAEKTGEAFEQAADRAASAWDGFLSMLPPGIRNIANSVGQLVQGFSNAGSNFLFGRAGSGQAGAFGGLFGSNGQASAFAGALGPGAGIGGAIGGLTGNGGAGIGGALGFAATSVPAVASFLATSGGGGAIASLLGTTMSAVIPVLGTVIGALIGSLFGGDNNTNTSSQISFGQSRGGRDMLVSSEFGQIFLGSGRDGFHEIQPKVAEVFRTFFSALGDIVTDEQREAITGLLAGRPDLQITREMVESGNFLDPIFEMILGAFDNQTRAFVGQFSGDIETSLDALVAITDVIGKLDNNPLQRYADGLALASETTQETLVRLGGELSMLATNAFGSVETMQAFSAGIDSFDTFVIQSLAGFDQAGQVIGQTIEGAISAIQFQAIGGADPEAKRRGQFAFLTAEAERLAGTISGLSSAGEVTQTTQLIAQLVGQAFGLADAGEQAGLVDQFSGFLGDVGAAGQARVDELRAAFEAEAEAQRAAMVEAFNEAAANIETAVTNGFENAGIGAAGDLIYQGGERIWQAAQTPITVQVQYDFGELGFAP